MWRLFSSSSWRESCSRILMICFYASIFFTFGVMSQDAGYIDCTYIDNNNNFYDLSSLTNNNGDYSVQVTVTPYIMVWFNICRKLVTQPYGWYAAIETKGGSFASLGEQEELGSLPDFTAQGTTVKILNGIPCDAGKNYAYIYVNCDQTADEPVFTNPKLLGNCGFSVNMATKAGCPQTNGSSGWVFILVFFLVFGVYLIGGMVYRMRWKQKEFSESVPNRKFWKKLPGLVWDGCKYSAKHFVCLCGINISIGNGGEEGEPLTS